MFRQFGLVELIVVLLVLLLFIGPSNLPVLARSVAKTVHDIHRELSRGRNERRG